MKTTKEVHLIKSHHAEIRFQQRGIIDWAVAEVLKYGESIHKQGCIFKYMPKREIDRYYLPNQAKALYNLVLLQSAEEVIITGYKHPDAIRKIKLKSKRLFRKEHSKRSAFSTLPSPSFFQAA
jgi:hypothetical protein